MHDRSREEQSLNVLVHNIRWRCPDTSCRKSLSIREGSFFAQSKLELWQWLVMLNWWCRQYPVSDAAEEALTSRVTAIQAYQYFRDICSWRLTSVDAPLLLGGPGKIVQIDESLFRHKPKVTQTTKIAYAMQDRYQV